MTDTEPTSTATDTTRSSQPSGDDSLPNIDPSLAEGRGRLLLFGGMGWLAIGHAVDTALVVWGGVLIVTLAFGLNTAGKFVHYRERSLPRDHEVTLAASWGLLALTIVGLVTNYAYSRYGPGDGSFLWSLAVAGVGFGLLHMAAQSEYLAESSESTATESSA